MRATSTLNQMKKKKKWVKNRVRRQQQMCRIVQLQEEEDIKSMSQDQIKEAQEQFLSKNDKMQGLKMKTGQNVVMNQVMNEY